MTVVDSKLEYKPSHTSVFPPNVEGQHLTVKTEARRRKQRIAACRQLRACSGPSVAVEGPSPNGLTQIASLSMAVIIRHVDQATCCLKLRVKLPGRICLSGTSVALPLIPAPPLRPPTTIVRRKSMATMGGRLADGKQGRRDCNYIC